MDNEYLTRNKHWLRKLLDFACLTPLGAIGISVLAILPVVPYFESDYLVRWYISAAISAGLAIAFDFSGGIGIINFGFAAFFGFGAYTSALTVIHFGMSPWIGIFLGFLSTALLGFLTGVVSLRLRGVFAICFTWFVGMALMGLAQKMVFLTRGNLGLTCPYLFETTSNLPYFYTIIVIVLLTYVVLSLVNRSHYGMAFRAIGQNLEAARTLGINPVQYRIINFVLSSAFAGLIGGFYAHYYGILHPDLLGTTKTTEVMVFVFVGGRGSLWGGFFAAIPLVFGLEMMRSTFSNLPGINLIIYGVFLIAIMLYYPGGIAHFYRKVVVQSKSKFVRRFVQ
jgi:branched-chain amino acid transport system permease protein